MEKVTIALSTEMRDRIKKLAEDDVRINVSRVCQEALEFRLRCEEGMQETKESSMFERLQAQAQEGMVEARKGGYEEGVKWAKDADLDELDELKAYSENKIGRGSLTTDITDILDPDGDERHERNFYHREEGFIEGAVAAFDELPPFEATNR